MESPESFQILPRAAAAALERALSTNPVVALLGARQTGKTTLLRTLPALARRTYLTLDDFDLRNLARSDPESIVARAKELVIDEVRRLCLEVNQEGRGVIGISSYLAPNSLLLMGQGDTLDRLVARAPSVACSRSLKTCATLPGSRTIVQPA